MIALALICDIDLESGLTVENAYLRIKSFNGSESRVSFILYIYTNKDNFKNGKPAISQKSYNMDFDKDRNLFRQMYNFLLTLPEYENATEA